MSWEQLAGVLRDDRAAQEEQAAAAPVACPNDGEPLQAGPTGQLFCPFDGWRYDGAPLVRS